MVAELWKESLLAYVDTNTDRKPVEEELPQICFKIYHYKVDYVSLLTGQRGSEVKSSYI